MSNKLRKSLEALIEINDRELFKSFRVCKLETRLCKNQEVFQRRKKVKSSTAKNTFLKKISPAFLALGFVQDDYQSDVRQSGWRVSSPPGDLDNGCQVDVYVRPSGSKQVAWLRAYLELIRGLPGYTPRHWLSIGKFKKVLVSRQVRRRMESFLVTQPSYC